MGVVQFSPTKCVAMASSDVSMPKTTKSPNRAEASRVMGLEIMELGVLQTKIRTLKQRCRPPKG